jgi:hypothetical protein
MSHYYPELGGTAPATALMIGLVSPRGGFRIKWSPSNHEAVLAAMARAKVSAKNVEEFTTVKGGRKWAAHVTAKAYAKLQAAGIASTECLLD